ncbi:MAG TPA: DUF6159 family protein [Gemmatales bacterium]|nr:DUF6159 family protein [Gemmatales bacterium]
MFATFQRSWEMISQSYGVLKKQKTLVLFPILSGLACLLVVVSFAIPVLMKPELIGQLAENGAHEGGVKQIPKWIMGIVGFAFYLVNYFIIIFFNVALASCAVMHFKGIQPTLGDGLSAAGRRLPQILGWAFVAATVGMILKAIQDRSEWLGRLVVGLLGLAWTVVTFLVVPVLAVEGKGPIDSLKRSSQLIRHSWGESLAGGLGFGLIGFLLMLPGFLLFMAGIGFLAAEHKVPVAVAGLALGVIYLVVVNIVLSTLQQIFISGLYLYSAEGVMPSGYSPELVQEAFQKK